MKEQIDEIEHAVGKLIIIILPALRARKEVLIDEFELLFKYLEEISKLTKGNTTLNKSLAYKLFLCYFEISPRLSKIPNDVTQKLQSKLFMSIVNILNEDMFERPWITTNEEL